MGLDMMVHEVSIFDLKDMSAFCQKVINRCCPIYNVHNDEMLKIDLENIINEDPTFSIPWNLGRELCYWRKHPDLHGWMRNLYYEKGGTGDFNGHSIVLTKENVLQLRKDIENENFHIRRDSFLVSHIQTQMIINGVMSMIKNVLKRC